MLIWTAWTADGHREDMMIWQACRVTAGTLAFHLVLGLPLSRWRVVLGKKKENQKSCGKQITAFLDRCCSLFLTAGHGYNRVCFDFSQHIPHRQCIGGTTLIFFFSIFLFLNLCGLSWHHRCMDCSENTLWEKQHLEIWTYKTIRFKERTCSGKAKNPKQY